MANRPRIFITQKIRVDFQKVLEFGEPIFITAGRDDFHDQAEQDFDLLERIQQTLSDFDEEQDFIVLTGSPYVNAAVMWQLGRFKVRRVQFLRWNNSGLFYERLTLSVPMSIT